MNEGLATMRRKESMGYIIELFYYYIIELHYLTINNMEKEYKGSIS